MEKNKTGKYLKYALGEIVLVVIGILIALSLNNINEQRKLRIKEVKVLKEINADLKITLADISDDLSDLERNLNSSIIIRNAMLSKESFHDSLINHYERAMDIEILLPKSSTYESLKSFGLDLISNDSIQNKITSIYQDKIPIVGKGSAEVNDASQKLEALLIPYIKVDSSKINKSKWLSYNFIDYDKFLKTDMYLVVLQRSIPFRRITIVLYKRLEEYVENTILAIDEEIKILKK